MFYHATLKENIDSIMHQGIQPQIGENSKVIGEEIERVYLFNTLEDLINALGQWFGDLFDDDDELIIFEIEIDPKDYHLYTPDDLYESYYYQTIPPHAIKAIYDEYEIEKKYNSEKL